MGLTTSAADWPWSSAAAHLAGAGTPHVDLEPALARVDDLAASAATLVKQHGGTFSPAKRGPKPRLAPPRGKSGQLFGD